MSNSEVPEPPANEPFRRSDARGPVYFALMIGAFVLMAIYAYSRSCG